MLRGLQLLVVLTTGGALIYILGFFIPSATFGHGGPLRAIVYVLMLGVFGFGSVVLTLDAGDDRLHRSLMLVGAATLAMWAGVILGMWSVGPYFLPAATALTLLTLYIAFAGWRHQQLNDV